MIHVVTYHSIDSSGSVLSTSADLLERQWRAWREQGHRFLSLQEFTDRLDTGGIKNRGAEILLTFDDGLESVYEAAFPLIQALDLPAAVFLVADHIGGSNDWPHPLSDTPRWKIMSWDQARRMHAAGVEFGCHSSTHPDLCTLDEVSLRREIDGARKKIEDQLGNPIRTFAYPYGRSNDRVRALISQTYALAFGTRLDSVGDQPDRLDLPRLDAYYLRPSAIHRRLGSPLAAAYFALRRAGRCVRLRKSSRAQLTGGPQASARRD
jgi:peptidoglycan/xylan/chitin deacetylase (PgdA/CDA1 family)